ncbi:MAG: hypothetical protein ACRDSP_05635 [Pseudonocardiaceae bacterium]
MSGPDVVALVDQADAAGRDGARIIGALAAEFGGTLRQAQPGGAAAVIVAKLLDRAASGQLAGCLHLSPTLAPVWWLASRPGWLRCLTCAQRAAPISDQHAGRTCDLCGAAGEVVYPHAVRLRPIVLDPPGLLRVTGIGPVICLSQLCATCRPVHPPDPT